MMFPFGWVKGGWGDTPVNGDEGSESINGWPPIVFEGWGG